MPTMTIVLEEERLEQAVLADSAGGVVASIVVGARPSARRVQGDTFLHLAAGAGATINAIQKESGATLARMPASTKGRIRGTKIDG